MIDKVERRALFGFMCLLAVAGYGLLCYAAGPWAAVGVFLLSWANNVEARLKA